MIGWWLCRTSQGQGMALRSRPFPIEVPSRLTPAVFAMRIITADETGLVKVVRLESGECLAVSAGEQTRARAVRAICHSNAAFTNQEADSFGSIYVARVAGAVETWDMSQSKRTGTNGDSCSLKFREPIVDCAAEPVALACLPIAPGNSERSRFLTCNANGEVQVSFAASDHADDGSDPASFSVRGPVSAAIAGGMNAGGSAALAAGGKDNDLKIWDIHTTQCTWKAKNVPHDFLDMRQPVWISSLRSLVPEAEGGAGAGGLQQIVAGTAHRQVRLYDLRAQKRPTHSVDADEHGVTTMAVARDGKEVVVADTAGLIRVLDLRKMKWGRRFEGPGGSVRGLTFHPTLPVLACVGLDRMARVYDYRSTEQKFQVYLKQRLNDVLFDGEGEVRVAPGAAETVGNKKVSKSNGKGEDWSGSEGWGSEEEYEMAEGDSSEEEEEEEEERRRVGSGSRTSVAATNRRGPAGNEDGESESEEDQGGSSSSREEEAGGFGMEDEEGSSSDSVNDHSESEAETQAPPPKRRNVQKGSMSSNNKRRR